MTRRHRRDERGATLIVVALFMTGLMVIVALVIDLSVVRQNRQTDKSATDFAAAAGVRGLDDGTGLPNVWQGICAAREFLVVNNEAEFSPLTSVDPSGTPITDPCISPPTVYCSSSADHRTYSAIADGGRIRVTIEAGYDGSDPPFAEDLDSGAYGSAPSPGCDHLAVIVEEFESPNFGAAAGSPGHETRIRSVGRLHQSGNPEVTAALLILERTDCPSLLLEGSSGASIRVEGNASSPGVIHADSLASGGSCASGRVFQVNGATAPVVVAAASPDGSAPGQITTVSAINNPSASSSGTPAPVCPQLVLTDCAPPAPSTGGSIEARPLVGRGVVDVRYRQPIIDLRNDAAAIFAVDPSTAADVPGFDYRACADPGPFTATAVWIDCGGGAWDGRNKVFIASDQTVVIDGYIEVQGGGNNPPTDPAKQLRFDDVDRIYVRGRANGQSIRLAGTNNVIRINDRNVGDGDGDGSVCDDVATDPTDSGAQLVVGRGSIVAEGGDGKTLRMCNTTVFTMDSSGTTPCPVPSADGVPPYDNTCAGSIRVAGQNRLDWTAPNITNGDPTAFFDDFEDLAYWSETQSGNAIEGNGGVLLAGIFFTPNATPFRVGGQGSYDIEDAQFITRRLQVAGNATLLMRPQPNNSVQIPALGGFGLVR